MRILLGARHTGYLAKEYWSIADIIFTALNGASHIFGKTVCFEKSILYLLVKWGYNLHIHEYQIVVLW